MCDNKEQKQQLENELRQIEKEITYRKVALSRINEKILFFKEMIAKLHNGSITDEEILLLWRRLRDKTNKNKDLQFEMVKHSIMGGIAPSIITGMGEEDV